MSQFNHLQKDFSDKSVKEIVAIAADHMVGMVRDNPSVPDQYLAMCIACVCASVGERMGEILSGGEIKADPIPCIIQGVMAHRLTRGEMVEMLKNALR